MIPKKIHYCWFSGEPYPDSIQRCLDSWRKFLPDFEWVHWDAEKARATGIPWVVEALEQKKWAFAADAVRLYALYSEGGIYLDTDVEVLKSFDDLLDREYFVGYENGSKRIEGAVMGAAPNSPVIAKALEFYQTHPFGYEEREVDGLVLPNILARAFEGLPDLDIFPESVFSPKTTISMAKFGYSQKRFAFIISLVRGGHRVCSVALHGASGSMRSSRVRWHIALRVFYPYGLICRTWA
jgi:Mannosyltransferase OCH1 and related enzymes